MCWRSSTVDLLTHVVVALHCEFWSDQHSAHAQHMQHMSGAQADALNVEDVLAGGNLVYSAPYFISHAATLFR